MKTKLKRPLFLIAEGTSRYCLGYTDEQGQPVSSGPQTCVCSDGRRKVVWKESLESRFHWNLGFLAYLGKSSLLSFEPQFFSVMNGVSYVTRCWWIKGDRHCFWTTQCHAYAHWYFRESVQPLLASQQASEQAGSNAWTLCRLLERELGLGGLEAEPSPLSCSQPPCVAPRPRQGSCPGRGPGPSCSVPRSNQESLPRRTVGMRSHSP